MYSFSVVMHYVCQAAAGVDEVKGLVHNVPYHVCCSHNENLVAGPSVDRHRSVPNSIFGLVEELHSLKLLKIAELKPLDGWIKHQRNRKKPNMMCPRKCKVLESTGQTILLGR